MVNAKKIFIYLDSWWKYIILLLVSFLIFLSSDLWTNNGNITNKLFFISENYKNRLKSEREIYTGNAWVKFYYNDYIDCMERIKTYARQFDPVPKYYNKKNFVRFKMEDYKIIIRCIKTTPDVIITINTFGFSSAKAIKIANSIYRDMADIRNKDILKIKEEGLIKFKEIDSKNVVINKSIKIEERLGNILKVLNDNNFHPWYHDIEMKNSNTSYHIHADRPFISLRLLLRSFKETESELFITLIERRNENEFQESNKWIDMLRKL